MTDQDEYENLEVGPPMPCFVCDRLFHATVPCGGQAVLPDGTKRIGHVQLPYGGTVFATSGHYGSTFWDSFDGELIEITICDPCLRKRLHKVQFLKPVRFHPTVYERFRIPEERREAHMANIEHPFDSPDYKGAS